jgi:hypothetical protein
MQPTSKIPIDDAQVARSAPSTDGSKSDSGTPERDEQPVEIGGRRDGLDPTRYGDWEKAGRCIDF